MDEQFIINQIKSGNTQAYKILVLRYQKAVFRYLQSFGLPQPLIEEVAQEGFFRAYKCLADYDSQKSTFSTWLFVIVKNLGINELNRHSYIKEDMPEELPEQIEAETPFSLLDKRQLSLQLDAMIKMLPLQFRNALVLFHLNEMTLTEISQIEECSVGTVKSRLFRAKELLKIAFIKNNMEDK